MIPQESQGQITTQKQRSRASPFTLFLLITAILMVVVGSAGYYLGWTQGHAPLQQATLRVSVHNTLPTNQSVQVLVNGKVRDTIVIPAGQTTTLDEQVAFATSDGAYFNIDAIAASGRRSSAAILMSGPGIYPVALSFG
jgi:hypothetical protein